jgi:(2Fe-2S) ferredoxin
MKYKKHIFICTNDKPAPKKCCGSDRGGVLVDLFKEKLKEHDLHKTMRAQKTGCLDVCAFGPGVVVYPEGVFYGGVTPEDVNEIFESHILNDKPVERLMLPE